jgi:preprotein translocase subunit SecG
MLDKILFWVVLVWMIGMLVMAFLAVREVWQEASHPPSDADDAPPPAGNDSTATAPKDPSPK